MDTASSSYDTLPVTSPSEPGEGLGKEEVVGVFFIKTGNLYYPGVLTLQVTLLFVAPCGFSLGN